MKCISDDFQRVKKACGLFCYLGRVQHNVFLQDERLASIFGVEERRRPPL